MDKEQWDEVIHVNLDSVFNSTKQVLPFMLERKSGRILTISSFVALGGNVGQSNYAATKAGIIGFSKSVALEVARHGITVNVVCPGFTETDMLMEVPEKIRQRILEKIPMARFGKSEEVAACSMRSSRSSSFLGRAISLLLSAMLASDIAIMFAALWEYHSVV